MTSDMIILYHYNSWEGMLIDADSDTYSPTLGAFTWRRLIHEHPDCAAIGSFRLADLSDPESTIAPQISEHIFFRAKDTSDATLIATDIAEKVRAAVTSDPDWGYRHSATYDSLVERNRIEAERLKSGKLAPWELELMGAHK